MTQEPQLTTAPTTRAQRALQRAIDEAQARHQRNWNAHVARMVEGERRASAAAHRAPKLRIVR